MTEEVTRRLLLGSFKELLEWSESAGMTKRELDERAVKICLSCSDYSRCANLTVKDWCYGACVSSILSWAEERGIEVIKV